MGTMEDAPGDEDQRTQGAANTDVDIWRAGQPVLTRADIDALIEAVSIAKRLIVPITLDVSIASALEKLQIIRSGDYYADSIHVTERGGIGMNVGGTVVVMPIERWHALAIAETKRQEIEPRDPDAAGLFICSMDGGTHQGTCPTCGCVVQAPYNEESVKHMGFDWDALQRLRVIGELVRHCPYCLDHFTAETYALHRCSKRPPEAPR